MRRINWAGCEKMKARPVEGCLQGRVQPQRRQVPIHVGATGVGTIRACISICQEAVLAPMILLGLTCTPAPAIIVMSKSEREESALPATQCHV